MTRCSFGCLSVLVAIGALAQAQTPAAPKSGAEPATQIKLGDSAMALNGPWKFSVGDSPLDPGTGAPLWAEPEFDDSHWETVDLTPAQGAADPLTDKAGYVPGWTDLGHAGYWGYAWYRMRVRVDSRAGEKLALAGPADVDDVYQIFANGRLLGGFGDFSGREPAVFSNQPELFPFPATTGTGESPTVVLAFRVWMQPATPVVVPDSGGMHNAPVLGKAGAVSAGYQLRWLELLRVYASWGVEAALFALVGLVALSLTLFDRSDRVYLWIGAVFLVSATAYGDVVYGALQQSFNVLPLAFLSDCLLPAIYFPSWVMVWWVWFGRPKPAWIPYLAALLGVAYLVTNTVREELLFTLIPHRFALPADKAFLLVRILLSGLQVWVVIAGIRKQGREGWLVLPAVLLFALGTFGGYLRAFHLRLTWFPFGVWLSLVQVATMLLVLVIALLLLRRLLLSVRRQRQMALDVKQAQEVQQMILPEERVTYPGLVVETVFRPAREVGGDFFQMIPNEADGSLLIVAGDVAGKGLQAGMLVALLVGAIRTAVEMSYDPAFVLGVLNRRLVGRGEAAATCLALRIEEDGRVTLANSGHMPPYLNGTPVAMDGALPLGMFAGAECSVMRFQLAESDRLMLMSDGILEATDTNGQLFGFERIAALLNLPVSPAQVADAAQAFGQEDDISVIAVTRTAIFTPVLV